MKYYDPETGEPTDLVADACLVARTSKAGKELARLERERDAARADSVREREATDIARSLSDALRVDNERLRGEVTRLTTRLADVVKVLEENVKRGWMSEEVLLTAYEEQRDRALAAARGEVTSPATRS